MPLIATQIDQTDSPFPIEGQVTAAFADSYGNRYLVVDVLTPWGPEDVILDFDECKVETKRLN